MLIERCFLGEKGRLNMVFLVSIFSAALVGNLKFRIIFSLLRNVIVTNVFFGIVCIACICGFIGAILPASNDKGLCLVITIQSIHPDQSSSPENFLRQVADRRLNPSSWFKLQFGLKSPACARVALLFAIPPITLFPSPTPGIHPAQGPGLGQWLRCDRKKKKKEK